jgi:hypothetical protein
MKLFSVTFRMVTGSPKQTVTIKARSAESARFKFLCLPKQQYWRDPEIISVTEQEAS